MGNKLRRIFAPTPEEQEEDRKSIEAIFEEQAKRKGCITCSHCHHVISYPGFVTGEEYECDEGHDCDTVLGTVQNCSSWEELRQPEQKWIPCSERLPKTNGRYIVTRGLKACNAIWNRVYIINYSDLMGLKAEKIWWDGNVGKSDFQKIDDVIAWMPLPEPYKGEQE